MSELTKEQIDRCRLDVPSIKMTTDLCDQALAYLALKEEVEALRKLLLECKVAFRYNGNGHPAPDRAVVEILFREIDAAMKEPEK